MKKLKIDPELRDLLPPLTSDEYKQLEKNIVENGFDINFPIMEWRGFIVDGHNRYNICKKHNIDFIYGTLAYETKEEVMEWMLDIQLGRRNLSPIQRIAVTEKYRPIYERQAKENQSRAVSESNRNRANSYPSNLTELDNNNFKIRENETNSKLAKIAGVKPTLYKMGAKVLSSDNEEVKKRVLSGETSISAGYKELNQKKQENENKNGESNYTTTSMSDNSSHISDEVKQICADLKTEKTKEYLDSVWDYEISVIECMNADFDMYFGGFKSILQEMEGRVSKSELDKCITNAENIVEKMLLAIEEAKNIKLKMED